MRDNVLATNIIYLILVVPTLGWDYILKSPCFLARRVRRRLSPPRVVCFSFAWEFHVFSHISSTIFVHNVMLPFAVPWIPLPSCHSSPHLAPPPFPCPPSYSDSYNLLIQEQQGNHKSIGKRHGETYHQFE
jgi:hypothetical protein